MDNRGVKIAAKGFAAIFFAFQSITNFPKSFQRKPSTTTWPHFLKATVVKEERM